MFNLSQSGLIVLTANESLACFSKYKIGNVLMQLLAPNYLNVDGFNGKLIGHGHVMCSLILARSVHGC